MALQFGLDKICIGKLALASGTNAISIGNSSTSSNTNSIAIGPSTVCASQYGICIGNTCYVGTAGSATTPNISIGYGNGNSAASMTLGNNIALGTSCFSTATGNFGHCIAIGDNIMGTGLLSGDLYNIGMGANVLSPVTTGYENIAIGQFAGNSITTGYHNTMMGYSSGASIVDGYHNTCIGRDSGSLLVNGYDSTFIGTGADGIAAGYRQLAVGASALANTVSVSIGSTARTYDYGVAIGANAVCTPGGRNVAIGANSLASAENAVAIGGGPANVFPVASGISAIAIGGGSAGNAVVSAEGARSIAIGMGASTTARADSSIAIGGSPAKSTSAYADGTSSISIGYDANSTTTNVNSWGDNICIGSSSTSADFCSINIGRGNTAANTYCTYGNATNTIYHRFNVKTATTTGQGVDIYGANPLDFDMYTSNTLRFYLALAQSNGHYGLNAGDMRFSAFGGAPGVNFIGFHDDNGWVALLSQAYGGCNIRTAWGNISDARLKTNIQPIRNMLETCKNLKVRSYSLKDPNVYYYGWIAQEVLLCLTEEEKTNFNIIGTDTRPDSNYYTLFPQELYTINFKATQELAAKYEILTNLLQKQESEYQNILIEFLQLQSENQQIRDNLSLR